MERFGRIALKTILWIIASLIFLILLIVVLIQVPAIQNYAKDKTVTFLEAKIHTKVKIGHISLGLPKMLVLNDVYFEDQKKDTLLAGESLKVDISLFKLLDHKVEINEVDLQGITANVHRDADSVFNFDYIIKAFSSAQKATVKPVDTSGSMKFSIGKIILDNIHASFKDKISGYNIKLLLGHFDTRLKDFDLDKKKFTVPKINLSGLDALIIQTPTVATIAKAKLADAAITPISMKLKLGTIDIEKIKVVYRSNQMASNLDLGKLFLEVNDIDLKKQKVNVKSIELSDTRSSITFSKPESVKKTIVKAVKKLDTLLASPQTDLGWSASLKQIKLTNDAFKFDNNAQNPAGKGLDYGHMNINGLNLDAEDLNYSTNVISGKINNLALKEKSGLIVKKLRASFLYGPKKSYLNDLYLETPQTTLQKQIQINYPSIASLSNDPAKLFINANLNGSRVGIKDILLFAPFLANTEPFKNSANSVFLVNGRVIGRLNNLHIPSFEISGLNATHIKASGLITGLPDIKNTYFDIKIDDFNTNGADFAKMVPAGTIPASVTIPQKLNLNGFFKGSINDFTTNLNLRTDLGALDINGSLKNANNSGHEIYSANIKANNLNLGALIKQPETFGTITLTSTINGTGFNPKTANFQISGNIVKAGIKGYTYQNLVLTGMAKNGNYSAKARMKDPNINFNLDARADMNKKYPSVNATLQIDSINLQKLNFSKDDLRFHGKLVADVPTADPDYLNANLKITDIVVALKQQVISLDTVSLVSTANADSSTIKLKAPMLYAHMAGKYKLTEVGTALQEVISKYFNSAIAKASAKSKPSYSTQQFSFDIHVAKTPLTTKLLPSLKTLDPVLITGHFNSETGDLVVNGTMPRVVYGKNSVSNLKLAVKTGNGALNYNLTVDEIKYATSFDLLNTSLTGSAQNDKLNINLLVKDAAKKERYKIAGVFSLLPNEYQFSFTPNGLLLDYKQWAVNADNALQFGGKGLMAKDFSITNSNQVLSVNSDQQQMNAPVTVNFKDFHIETLTRLAQQDSLRVGGVINGEVHLSNLDKAMQFTSALNIGDFNFRGDTVGNIAVKVNNQTADAYTADINITGKGNQVNLTGMYYTNPESKFDMNLNIVNLNLKSIEGFSYGSLRNASGAINGQLKVSGTTDAPVVRGDLNFAKAAFNVATLNSYFRMPDERVTFNNDGILFNDFTMIDSLGNKAIVTGTLYTKTYTDYRFGLDIQTNNFRVVNSTKADNKLYYGKLFLDSHITIRGDMDAPVIDAALTVNDKTDLTIVLPENDPGVEDRKGVVEFINPNAPKLDSIFLAKQLDSLRKTTVKGLDISATIKINKAAKFTVVIDESTGDIVQLQGDAQLNAAVDKSGKINLTGIYTINQGSYNLSYATVKRKFLFKKGSTIAWTGDPTSANINVTATYVANVPPIDLVQDQVNGGTSSTQTQFKQKLPFNVNLALKNDLLKPNISFDIVLPDSSYTVSPEIVATINSRLNQIRQDTNEMNKQVLGVLVLGHFIGDNPLQSQGGGTTVNGTIRNSVSSLLSDQLNKLSGNLIAGVQLSFDLTSGADYSSGLQQNRTDLNVGLSKQFLNDRVTVTVGNNFNLEGQNQPGQKSTNIAGNISVNYKLTDDGRYLIRAYRKDEYIVVEGEVVETGIGFTLTYDYNRFKELFAKKPTAEKERELKYKQEQKEKDLKIKEATQKADSVTTPALTSQNKTSKN